MHLEAILWALAGGLILGAGASLLLLANGRIAGISGILGGLVSPVRGEVAWRALFVAGLLVGGILSYAVWPERFDASGAPALPLVVVAGLLVGIGTRIGGGCTSGHGVCGISRLSARSLVATLTFMVAGVVTVGLLRSMGVVS